MDVRQKKTKLEEKSAATEAETISHREDKEDEQSAAEAMEEDGDDEQKENEKKQVVRKTEPFRPVQSLLSFIVRACDDKAPTVRARAIFQLTDFLEDQRLRDALPQLSTRIVSLFFFFKLKSI